MNSSNRPSMCVGSALTGSSSDGRNDVLSELVLPELAGRLDSVARECEEVLEDHDFGDLHRRLTRQRPVLKGRVGSALFAVVATAATALPAEAGTIGLSKASSSSHSEPACPKDYYQHEPIVLSCHGGLGRKNLVLTGRDLPQSEFAFHAPIGTQDFTMNVALRAPGVSDYTAAKATSKESPLSLSVECVGKDTFLIDGSRGLLNDKVRTKTIAGAKWQWSGTAEPNKDGFFVEGFKFTGQLSCDAKIKLENKQPLPLMGDLQYEWTVVSPCPSVMVGCALCPKDVCHNGEVAVCDGSPSWVCRKGDSSPGASTTASPALAASLGKMGIASVAAANLRSAHNATSHATNATKQPKKMPMLCIPGPMTRSELESQIFARLDQDTDGHLSEDDLKSLAVLEGKHAEGPELWQVEYKALQLRFNISEKGASEEVFKAILEDGNRMGRLGFYTLVSWAALLEKVDQQIIMGRLIFGHLDTDHDGKLSKSEMVTFENLSGAPTLMKQRAHEFSIDTGNADFNKFLDFVDKPSKTGSKLTMYTLGRVLSQLVDEDPRWRYARLIFAALDTDHDGYLAPVELHHFAQLLDTTHTSEENKKVNPFTTAFRDLIIENVASKGSFDDVAFGRFLRTDRQLFTLQKLELVLAKLEADHRMSVYYTTTPSAALPGTVDMSQPERFGQIAGLSTTPVPVQASTAVPPSAAPALATTGQPQPASTIKFNLAEPASTILPNPFGDDESSTEGTPPGTQEPSRLHGPMSQMEPSQASPEEIPPTKTPVMQGGPVTNAPPQAAMQPSTLQLATTTAFLVATTPPAELPTVEASTTLASIEQPAEADMTPTWSSFMKTVLLGGGAFVGAFAVAAMCVWISIHSQGPRSTQPRSQNQGSRDGAGDWLGAQHFDRLPTNDDATGLLSNLDSNNRYQPLNTDHNSARESTSVDGLDGL
eukprot:TRINITY_DN28824_c0_g1_i1.p1 TRINITY_DN28824_c0_g1~~TRINITY_DN28824_c0_g1_i1.p1  ORF type:complete len:937 (-),score=208.15 TRINITY_DN28824_c0_g1_i1:78-2888(-)